MTRPRFHHTLLRLFLAALLLMAPSLCRADEVTQCFREAAATYQIDPYLLLAVAQTESGLHPNIVNVNRTASGRATSFDMGLMQINSGWLPTLKKYGISRTSLIDPCTNIRVGAWILAGLIQHHGRVWESIGAYNASCNGKNQAMCRRLRSRYINKVAAHYAWIRRSHPF